MPLLKSLVIVAALTLSFCTAATLALVTASPGDIKGSTDIAVVVNPQNPTSDISLGTLKKLVDRKSTRLNSSHRL